MKLSELSSYIYLLGNDVRLLHLYATGENFMEIHLLLEDIYNLCFDKYDVFAEMAIAHGETIPNPTDILLDESIGWTPIFGSDFDVDFIKTNVIERGNKIISMGENLKGYENFVMSEVDDFNSDLDSLVNYKFGRI